MSIIIYGFIYLFRRETEREWGVGAEGENPQADSLPSVEPNPGPDPTTHEIMTAAKTKSWMLNQLSHQAPPSLHFLSVKMSQYFN